MGAVITGASGFIGSAVIKKLLAANEEVCILVRPDSLSISKYLACPGVKVITYTTLSETKLVDSLSKWNPTVMINLAWKGVAGNGRGQDYQYIYNIPYAIESVRLAANAGCTQWIGMGSQAEYGIPNAISSEDDCCAPVTAYGKAKLAACIATLGMCDTLNITGTWARIFSVYGPEDHSQTFISYVIASLLNNKLPVLTACGQKWDYLFITDAASAVVSLINNDCRGIFNIGSGNAIVLKDIVHLLQKIVSYKEHIIFGGKEYSSQQVMHLQANVTKIQQQTGWQPMMALQQGLQETVLSLQKNFMHESI